MLRNLRLFRFAHVLIKKLSVIRTTYYYLKLNHRWARGGQGGGDPPTVHVFMTPPDFFQDLLSKTPPIGALTPLCSLAVLTYAKILDFFFHGSTPNQICMVSCH